MNSNSSTLRFLRPLTAGSISIALLAIGSVAHAQLGEYSYDKTADTGEVTCSFVPVPGADRFFYVSQKSGDAPADLRSIGIDLSAAPKILTQLQLEHPEFIQLSKDGSRVYLLDYRAQKLLVVDAKTGQTQQEISGLPKFPTGLLYDSQRDVLYVTDSKAHVIKVDPRSGEVAPAVQLSKEKYPLAKQGLLDERNQVIWMPLGKTGEVAVYSLITGAWIPDASIQISNLEIGGSLVGGRPTHLAVDAEHNVLYVDVQAGLKDEWNKENSDKLVMIDIAKRQVANKLVRLGGRVNSLVVNPVSSEIYSLDSLGNTVTAVDPETWTATKIVDFGKLGVTRTDRGPVADANVCQLQVANDGSALYVSHPYGDKGQISKIDRTGGPAGYVSPFENVVKEPEPAPAPETPAQPPAEVAPGQLKTAEFQWSFNDYMSAWTTEPLPGAVKDVPDFKFGKVASASSVDEIPLKVKFEGGWLIKHYEGLVPDLKTWMKDPELVVNSDGTATLTMDVKWQVPTGEGLQTSDGFHRITVATFAKVDLVKDGDKVTVTGMPDFKENTYEVGDYTAQGALPKEFIDYFHPDMRAWWYSTGAKGDKDKPQNPISLSLEYQAKSAEPAEPAQPVEPEEPAKPADPNKPAEPAEPAEPVKPVEPAKPAEPTEPAKPADPVESDEPEEPVKPVEPAEPAEPVKPVEPTKPAEPTEPAKPAEGVVPTEHPEPEQRSWLPRTGSEARTWALGALVALSLGVAALSWSRFKLDS